jgi:hypothetical protein
MFCYVTKKEWYPLSFCEQILKNVIKTRYVHIRKWVQGLSLSENTLKDLLKTTFITPWGTFCYIIMPFGLCNVPKRFQCLMNKVFESFFNLFLWVYNVRTSHTTKLKLIFQRLNDLGMRLNLTIITIGFSKRKMVEYIMSKNGVAT